MLRAAVVPHPPALVPGVGRGLPEIEPVRVAAREAVAVLVAGADRVVVLGPDAVAVDADESVGGSFAGFGVALSAGGPRATLPAAYVTGAWLLDDAGWTGPRRYTSDLDRLDDGDVLLVLADADTSVGVSAATHGDPRAAAVEKVVAAALADGYAAALAELDPVEAQEWEGTGVAPLRTLGRLSLDETAKGASVAARLRSDETPFGVRYWVADWTVR